MLDCVFIVLDVDRVTSPALANSIAAETKGFKEREIVLECENVADAECLDVAMGISANVWILSRNPEVCNALSELLVSGYFERNNYLKI